MGRRAARRSGQLHSEVVPPPPVPDPGLELRPGDVEVGACPDAPVTVDLLSVGRTALTVEALELVGSAELHVTSDAAGRPPGPQTVMVTTVRAHTYGAAGNRLSMSTDGVVDHTWTYEVCLCKAWHAQRA